MALNLQFDILNGQPGDASPVEANFNSVQDYINQEVVTRDGATAMTGQLRLVGNPENVLDAAPKQYVDAVLPIGLILMYGGTGAPPGGKWALCNGASLSTAEWPELFAILGYSHGGSGGNFNLPNLGGRMPIGVTAVAPAVPLGSTGGSRHATLVSHAHANDHDHPQVNSGNQSANHTHTTPNHQHILGGSTGSAGSHSHSAGPFDFYKSFLGGGVLDINDGGPGTGFTLENDTASVGNHTHTLPAETGNADRSLETDGASVNHTHTVNIPAYTGSTSTVGGSATDANLPPYVGVNFVIRVS